MSGLVQVLVALALTVPPSLAVAYMWYIRSVTSFNIQEHQRATEHAKLQREEHVAMLMQQDKALQQVIEQLAAHRELLQEHQRTLDMLSDR